MSRPDLRLLPDAEAVASAAADLLVDHAREGHHIALAGGSTPRRAYRLAAERLTDWSASTLWLGDERVVPEDDERSNARMVREHLLASLAEDARPRFEAVQTQLDADRAASDYEVRLRGALRDGAGLDLVLLGLGPDAHTASLFPGKPAAGERERWVVGVPEAGMEPHVPRVTLTLPVLGAAREVAFVVAGADKAEAVLRAFGPEPDLASPAAHVRPRTGRLRILCDFAAARSLAAS